MKITTNAKRLLAATAIVFSFGLTGGLTGGLGVPAAADDKLDSAALETEKTKSMAEDQKDTASDKADDADMDEKAQSVKSDAMEKIKSLD